MIELPGGDAVLDGVWETLMALVNQESRGWTLIGAQMVALHALEHGQVPPRRSTDFDLLVNVRVLQDGTRRLSRALQAEGFTLDAPDLEGISHRFHRDQATVDLLAPEGVGERADLTTVPPARTIRVPGGTQALQRTEMVDVQLRQLRGTIPRPNLIGAIIVKACAIVVDDVPAAQRVDLACLLSLVENPRALSETLSAKDRQRLRAVQDLLDPHHPAWLPIADPEAGQRALRVLLR